MNSIETYPSSSAGSASVMDEGQALPSAISDLKALEALRSLLTPSQSASAESEPDTSQPAPLFPGIVLPATTGAGFTVQDSELGATPALDLNNPALVEALRAWLAPLLGQGKPALAAENIIPKNPTAIPALATDSTVTSTAGIQLSEIGDENTPEMLRPVILQIYEKLQQTRGAVPSAEALTQAVQRLLNEATPPVASLPLSVPDADPASEPSATPEWPNGAVPNLGHSILQTLNSQSSAQTAPVAATANAERLEQVSALMTEMADRVLVTDPLHGQTQEVRIKLADHVMPGTEVRVWREDGGQLRVEFDTSSGYWARVLNESSALLSQRLNERMNLTDGGAQVSVLQQGGQPEDGRSRNRQSPWAVAEQTDDQ